MVPVNIAQRIKSLPKWAWWTTGGVTIGAVALKVYGDRAKPADVAVGTDGEPVGDTYGNSTQPATTGSSPPGVIVPPIIVPANADSASDIAGAISGLFGESFNGLVGLVGQVVTGQQGNMDSLIYQGGQTNEAIIGLIAGAGGAPEPASMVPTPVIVMAPPPPSPPVATAPAGPKPCCHYSGHTLSWWQNAANARTSKGWRWPDGSTGHSRAFEGHSACDGGGTAGGSKRDC